MKSTCTMVLAMMGLSTFSVVGFETYQEAWDAAVKAGKARNFVEAAKNYEEAFKLTQNPNQKYQTVFNQAEALRQVRKWAEATKTMESILSQESATPIQKATAQIYLAHYLNWQRKYPQAEEAYKKIVDSGNQNWTYAAAMINVGTIQYYQKKYPEAIATLQEAAKIPKLTPDQLASVYLLEYRCYYAQKKYEEAQKALDLIAKLEKIHPNYQCEYHLAQGAVFREQKKDDAAIETFSKIGSVEKVSPGYLNAMRNNIAAIKYNQAIELRNQKKYPEAIEAFGKVAEADAKSWHPQDCIMQIGYILIIQKKYPEAIAQFQSMEKLDWATPDYQSNALVQQARVYQLMNQLEDAKKALDKSEKVAKTTPGAQANRLNQLGSLQLSQKDYQGAIASYEKTGSLPKVAPYYQQLANMNIANVYFNNLKDMEKAKEYYEKASKGSTAWITSFAKKRLKEIEDSKK